jgi:peptidoglycan/LPS O-acetylase OafA/YrhL
MSTRSSRFPFIDALKALASQLIVLHHLAYYGPMSDSAYELVPALIGWLSEYGRQAVPVFLVVGGFLAARSLAPRGRLVSADPLALIWQRYAKLVLPYLTALAVAIAGAAVARMWMEHDSIPAAPTLLQIMAHVLLLQDLAGVEALSAGIWYIAIDFQLFALLVALLWLARRAERAVPGRRQFGPALLVVAGCASLFFFNRDGTWDVSAFYFVGAYAMGVLCYWASARGRSPAWLVALAAVTGAALMLDFRSRLVVALAVALVLGLARRRKFLERWPDVRPVAFLGRISYSVFLVHFPVCLVVNALFYRFAGDDPIANLAGMAAAWAASTVAGALFFRLVEDPAREIRLAAS